MASTIRILIADDHPIVRQGLRTTIEEEPALQVVAEASDGRTALELLESLQPEIAVVDVGMPELDGIALTDQVRRRRLAVRPVILTIHREFECFERAMEAGALGYVLKDSALVEIVNCIRQVAAGNCYASPAIAGYLMERRRRSRLLQEVKPSVMALTPTEKRILLHLADYKTSSEIGELLNISPRTVDTHRQNISGKLELHGKHALMRFAVSHRTELG